MLQPTTLAFLRKLKANNNKPWFDENRAAYDAAKADFLTLVGRLLNGLSQLDPAIADTPLEPKKCVFRINRDVRFSKNKDPYKSHFGAWFNIGGKKLNSAGYYLHLEPGHAFVAGGLYMPEPPLLATVRQEIDYNLAHFDAIVQGEAFKKRFNELSREEALARPPKGYLPDNPAIEYLKLKSFTASSPLPDKLLTKAELPTEILAAYADLHPLIAFLNQSL
ncbi:DUF2461 domain-containing protein [Fibrella sp. HMF5335]|uniref:DUF2461 domain-containing protein n=1 Tax=Fibrella rubiginis TaxID=2817060 RepID=A0A939K2E1_9BACT|nr:DUF2461 domain-containing protein [Fibrella rubiginis]MBO0936219.1 DUF2461 domain-containing protein [Fibrella rubiginis]